jgi:DNA-directed RNA polymerase specialized sigma24 family protein
MRSQEQIQQRFWQQQRLKARLPRAAARLPAAEQERLWAIVTAHSEGLSIRKIATATGLSSSRVHPLLQLEEARQIAQAVNTVLTTGNRIEAPLAHLDPVTLAGMQQQ